MRLQLLACALLLSTTSALADDAASNVPLSFYRARTAKCPEGREEELYADCNNPDKCVWHFDRTSGRRTSPSSCYKSRGQAEQGAKVAEDLDKMVNDYFHSAHDSFSGPYCAACPPSNPERTFSDHEMAFIQAAILAYEDSKARIEAAMEEARRVDPKQIPKKLAGAFWEYLKALKSAKERVDALASKLDVANDGLKIVMSDINKLTRQIHADQRTVDKARSRVDPKVFEPPPPPPVDGNQMMYRSHRVTPDGEVVDGVHNSTWSLSGDMLGSDYREEYSTYHPDTGETFTNWNQFRTSVNVNDLQLRTMHLSGSSDSAWTIDINVKPGADSRCQQMINASNFQQPENTTCTMVVLNFDNEASAKAAFTAIQAKAGAVK